MTTININLLGIEQKERFRMGGGMPADRGWMIAIACASLGLILAVGGTVAMNNLVASAEEHKVALEVEIKSLEGQLGEIKNLESKKDQAIAEQRVLEYVTGKTYRWSSFLNEMRDMTPENLWVDQIAITGDTLSMAGNTFDHQTVAFFLANLQASPYFRTVTLNQSDKIIGKTATSVRFSMKAQLNYDVTPPSDAAAAPVSATTSASGQLPPTAKTDATRGKAAIRGNKARFNETVGG